MATITQASQERGKTERLVWLRNNRGALADIAKKLNVSHGKVRWVFHGAGRSNDGIVEQELAKIGAPGFAITKRRV